MTVRSCPRYSARSSQIAFPRSRGEKDDPRGRISFRETWTNFVRLVCEGRTTSPRQCLCRGADLLLLEPSAKPEGICESTPGPCRLLRSDGYGDPRPVRAAASPWRTSARRCG